MKYLLYLNSHGELISCKECNKIVYWSPSTIDGFCSNKCREKRKINKNSRVA